MKNKEKKNLNMSALRLSCIPRTRDSGPAVTVCRCYNNMEYGSFRRSN